MPTNLWFRAGATGLLVALVVLVGCNTGPRTHVVRGTVSLDGEPIEEGEITFTPEGGVHGPTQGKIKAGQYEFKAVEGMNKVHFSAAKIKPGGAKGAAGEPVPEDYLPERYHVGKSKQTAEVKAGGENKFDFPLKTKE